MKEKEHKDAGLYQRHRPKTLDEVVGHPEAVRAVKSWFAKDKVPHVIMLVGGSGVGKTTIARIIRTMLGCTKNDFRQLNCALIEKPMESVQEIEATMNMAPMSGKCRAWLLDEVQSLSRAQFAQQALLSILEDTPKHCYFMLATTDASKVIPTIRTRCTVLNLKPLDSTTLRNLVHNIWSLEIGRGFTRGENEQVIERIAEVAEGSARKALVLLQQVMHLPPDQQLDAVQSTDARAAAIEIARALVNKSTSWQQLAKIIKEVDEDPESLRRMILGYATTMLLSGRQDGRALNILAAFEKNFYDSGRAGLVLACAEVIREK